MWQTLWHAKILCFSRVFIYNLLTRRTGMNITNEQLYEMIVDMRSEFKDEIAAVKTAQSELRADISKWGVVLFIGSMVAMTSIIGVFLASVVLTI